MIRPLEGTIFFLPVCHTLDLWMFLREKDENAQASQEAVEIEKQRAWQLRNFWDDWIGATPFAWSSKLHPYGVRIVD